MNRLGQLGWGFDVGSSITGAATKAAAGAAKVAKEVAHATECAAEIKQVEQLKQHRMMALGGGLLLGAVVGYFIGKGQA